MWQKWSDQAQNQFESRDKCIREQYDAFIVEEELGKSVIGYVNGSNTLNKNFADIGGAALAWDAYRNYMEHVRPHIDNVTPPEGDQIFSLALAQSYCKKESKNYQSEQLLSQHHAPAKWRVNGMIVNHPKFADVFQCKPDAKMNPRKKVRFGSIN